ncbi:fimbrial protein [Herbaspirillum robiniae]|uniref:Fimbrial-type adhesion domain-containing protein n=1 Tax=Herbaspirillum robiniae TaxID=2014887 RepID=A0A246WJN3_9BURK|nr:fimbrial protein [Herbaspirillum robiniae]OWY26411.1 hypothetical protein CEJ42_24025 [Herbaspirillum robiniae]
MLSKVPLKSRMRYLLLTLLALGLQCFAPGVSAQSCSVDTPHTAFVNFPATVSVPRDSAASDLLTDWIQANSSDNWVCAGAIGAGHGVGFWFDQVSALQAFTTIDGTRYAIMRTNLAGIGIIAKARFSGESANSIGTPPVPQSFERSIGADTFFYNQTATLIRGTAAQDGGQILASARVTMSLALVRIGRVQAGTMSAGTLGNTGVRFLTRSSARPEFALRYTHPVTFSAVNIVAQTCSITPPGPVNLGTIPVKTFTGVGSVTPWGTSGLFSITVNCSGVKSKVHMVLTDQQNPGNVSSTLPLTRASTATGVGIQIFHSGGATPISFGPDSSLPGTTNQFLAFTSDNNTVKMDFNTRFIQTANRVTSGTANGIATFTMSYQ